MIKILIFLIFSNVFAEDVIWLPRNPDTIKTAFKEIKNKEFLTYLNDFKSDIMMEGNQLKRFNDIKIRVLDFDEPQSFYGNAICLYDKNEILISRNKWIVSSEDEKQQLIDHEMGHCVFGRIHVHTFDSIMTVNGFSYSKSNKKQLRKELMDKRLWNQIKILTQRIKKIEDPKKIRAIEIELVKNSIK